MQRFFTLVFLLLSSTLIAATPTKASSVEARGAQGQGVCTAKLRKKDEDVKDSLDKRWSIPVPFCKVPGWCSSDIEPLETNNMMSMQSCADQCKCSMGRDACKTFQWKEHSSIPGLGACSIYSEDIGNMGFVPDRSNSEGLGWFWQRDCYWKQWGPWPPPIMTNGWPWGIIPRATEAPAPISKREDASEKFWALVLAGE